MFETHSLTGSKAVYKKVGYWNGALLIPTESGVADVRPAPNVGKALKALGIPQDKPVALQYKIEGPYWHFQWWGAQKNRKYGAAFDVAMDTGASVTVSTDEYLTEDEMSF